MIIIYRNVKKNYGQITKVGKKSVLQIRIRLDPNYFTGSDQLFVQKIYIKMLNIVDRLESSLFKIF